MQHSTRYDTSPAFFQGASHVNASRGNFNNIGRDQYNYNLSVNDEIVADAYLDKLPRAVRAGYSSGNHKPCLNGTRQGVLSDIEAWEAGNTDELVYWLKGVAGCGKSTIAQTFADRSAAHGNLGASFFCSRDYPDRRNLHLIFPTLAYDLAYWSADFKTALVSIIRTNPNVQYDALHIQVEKLLVRPFKQTRLSATIVVDALDECEDREPVSEFLSALAVHIDDIPAVKFFITGRPEDHIRSGFKLPSLRTKELPLHDVESAVVDSDIKSFVKTRLDEIAVRRRQSISAQWPSNRDIATILKKTSGLFIIASVIIRFIDSPHASPQERLKLIVDLPDSTIYEGKSGIDVVYHQILSASFGNADEYDPDFLGQLHLVVGSIVLALKPLPRASLAEILKMTPEKIWLILTHLHSVLIVPESAFDSIRILHKSFADFITDQQRCPDERYLINALAHHSELGIRCLKLMKQKLMKNICRLPRYVMNDDVKDLAARRERYIGSPLSYACSSWSKHLQLSPEAGDHTRTVTKLVDEFLVQHLLSWLEVLSVEDIFHVAIYSLRDLRSWLNSSSAQDLLDLIDDCERFVLRSFDGIKQSAMHIYHSALSWAPTSSRTRILYEHELVNETKLLNAVGPTWDACIRIFPVGENARTIVFSHQGALIAAHGYDWVKIFDTMTGANRATFHESTSIESIAFSPDDDFVATGQSYGTLNIWDMLTGTLFRTFKCDMFSVYSVAFSPGGSMIAAGRDNGTIQIWNLLSGGCDYKYRHHFAAINSVCWLGEEQVMSGSNDCAVCIWHIQQTPYSSIYAQYPTPVINVVSSPRSILVASNDGTRIYDPRSGDIIHAIPYKPLTHWRLSVDGDKMLVASKDSGFIWDLTGKTQVQSIDYNGHGATFSLDGTYVASIYGKFLKIWKTQTGHEIHGASTNFYNEAIDDVRIAPDERLIALKSNGARCQILDTATGHSVFTGYKIASVTFSLTSVAFLRTPSVASPTRRHVNIWNTNYGGLRREIEVDIDILDIALSPDDCRLLSQSPRHVKLWDLETKKCLAHLEFDRALDRKEQVSFASDGASVSVNHNGRQKWWHISPASHTNQKIDFIEDHEGMKTYYIKNNEGTKSWLMSPPEPRMKTKQGMVFVPVAEKWSNLEAPRQFYCFGNNGEWMLDQCSRRVLWIPPDERPQETRMHGRMVIIRTESGKKYVVDCSVLHEESILNGGLQHTWQTY